MGTVTVDAARTSPNGFSALHFTVEDRSFAARWDDDIFQLWSVPGGGSFGRIIADCVLADDNPQAAKAAVLRAIRSAAGVE